MATRCISSSEISNKIKCADVSKWSDECFVRNLTKDLIVEINCGGGFKNFKMFIDTINKYSDKDTMEFVFSEIRCIKTECIRKVLENYMLTGRFDV